jgi:hypothetical protein
VTTASPEIDRRAQQEHLAAVCERGIDLCREGDWQQGLVDLAWLVKGKQAKNLPGLCYSYLGYGLAHTQKQVEKGRKYCLHGVKIEWFNAENYYNLARTCMLSERYKSEAVDAVNSGLKVDPGHADLLALHETMGDRRPPVLGFVSRGSFLNRILGALRHQLTKPKGKKGTEVKTASAEKSDKVVVS